VPLSEVSFGHVWKHVCDDFMIISFLDVSSQGEDQTQHEDRMHVENQSINLSIKSFNQINQPTQSINQIIQSNQPINQIIQSNQTNQINQSINQSINESFNQSN